MFKFILQPSGGQSIGRCGIGFSSASAGVVALLERGRLASFSTRAKEVDGSDGKASSSVSLARVLTDAVAASLTGGLAGSQTGEDSGWIAATGVGVVSEGACGGVAWVSSSSVETGEVRRHRCLLL